MQIQSSKLAKEIENHDLEQRELHDFLISMCKNLKERLLLNDLRFIESSVQSPRYYPTCNVKCNRCNRNSALNVERFENIRDLSLRAP